MHTLSIASSCEQALTPSCSESWVLNAQWLPAGPAASARRAGQAVLCSSLPCRSPRWDAVVTGFHERPSTRPPAETKEDFPPTTVVFPWTRMISAKCTLLHGTTSWKAAGVWETTASVNRFHKPVSQINWSHRCFHYSKTCFVSFSKL